MMKSNLQRRAGFALLMTLLVVSVIISVSLTILDVTIKQVRLSSSAKDSEIAFHAASAGLECAQYQRRFQSTAMESGTTITANCFGQTAYMINSTVSNISRQAVTVSGTGATASRYSYQATWGVTGETKCSQIDTIVIKAPSSTAVVSSSVMRTIIPGYPGTGKACPLGGICTVISVRGFNRTCPTTTGGSFPAGTVQREVLLEY
jgi:Tfp pilus assembly protein PilX